MHPPIVFAAVLHNCLFLVFFYNSFSAGDLVGFVLAWFSLLPIFILVGLGTLILVRRDLQTVLLGPSVSVF